MKKLFLLLALFSLLCAGCSEPNDPIDTPQDPTEQPGNDTGNGDEGNEDENIIDPTQAIKFQDENTKLICTLHWDENEDGELSYEEAAKVTDLGTAFKGSSILAFTELEHFTGLEGIADNAFNGCVSLVKISLPEQIASIGSSSFSGCSNLKKITIPNGVTSIGALAFEGCAGELIVNCNIPSASSSSYGGFYNSKFTKVTIGDGVTSIGDYAFYECSSLTSITIPDSVTTIGESAFWGCTGELIVNCNIPSASSSYYGAFYNSKFTKVTIGDSVTSIGDDAFYNCSSLTSVYYNGDLSDWCNIDFYSYYSNPLCNGAKLYINNTEVTEITIPSDISEIKNYTFDGCSSLTSVTIPESVTSIGDNAFYHCRSITSVTIPASVTSIGNEAFAGCDSLTSVTIGNSVASIGSYAFAWCESLTSVTIGNSVTSIANNAFEDCSSLTSITIPDSVTTIGDHAFDGCSRLISVIIPNSVTSIGEDAFDGCTGELIVNCNIPSASDYDEGAFYNSKFTKVTIGDSVTSIGDYAFYECSSIKSVTIPDSVTSIGNGTFYYCWNLTRITIGNGVTSIGNGTFYYCWNLTSITIPDSITSIGEEAFYNCSGLTSVYCKATTPPAGGNDMFALNDFGRTIYVPTESVNAYKLAWSWSYYKNDIVGYDFDNINTNEGRESDWALAGTFNGWEDHIMLTTNVPDIFVAKDINLEAYAEVKVKIVGSWDTNYGAGNINYIKANHYITSMTSFGANISVQDACIYDIYFDSLCKSIYFMKSGTDYSEATLQKSSGDKPI